MLIFFAYLTILILGLISILVRNKTILLRGKSFLKFNIFFLIIILSALIITKNFNDVYIIISILLIFFIISIFLRKKWILFRYNAQDVAKIIEDSLSKTLILFQKTENGYILKNNDGSEFGIILHVNQFLPKCAIIYFEEKLYIKKVEIWKNLLKKSFEGLFPRLVIKLK